MTTALRATAILGTSSVVTIGVGIASGKIYALLIGPAGVGQFALLNSLLGLGALIAGVSVGPGLVRSIARSISGEQSLSVAALRRAGLALGVISGGVVAAVLALFSSPISAWVLGDSARAPVVVLVALAVPLTVGATTYTSILNGYHRVAVLARVAVSASVLGAAASVALVAAFGARGIAPAVLASSAIALLVAAYAVTRSVPSPRPAPAIASVVDAARSLVRFGLPFTASVVAGSAVQLLLPILVLAALDTQHVGFYRAATAISVGYLAFLLNALSQDFFPRVAASDSSRVLDTIEHQQRLTMLLGVPILLMGLAFAPVLVPLLYSAEFRPAVDLLEWQLTGDVLRLPSWVFGFALLARGSSTAYLINELVAGAIALGTGVIGLHFFGLSGLGIAYLLTYAVYYAVVGLSLRRYVAVRPVEPMLLAGALLAALAIRSASEFVPAIEVRIVAGLLIALVVSAIVVWSLLPKVRSVNARQSA